MAERIILLSGPVASGKTTLGDSLCSRYGFKRLKTREVLAARGAPPDRKGLQTAGDRLDRRTGGTWVCDALTWFESELDDDAVILVDSVRIRAQIDSIRESFGSKVTHIHLTADDSTLATRYSRRSRRLKEMRAYELVKTNVTERNVAKLQDSADVVIDTARCEASGVLVRVASRLGLFGRSVDRVVDVLVGGQYGSEGKGNVAAYLSPDYDVLVRVGGPNAGHKVFQEPKPYPFHTLPSGTQRAPKASIVLGPGTMIRVPQLMQEIADCQVSASRLRVDPQAAIIEDDDLKAERSLVKAIGSTGQGVGWATARKILRDTRARRRMRFARDVPDLKPFLQETRDVLDEAFAKGKRIFLEGTQGTGLSLHHGSYPHVTSRDTTVSGCLAEAGIAPSRVRRIVMVCRTYPIRVQSPEGRTSGPLHREISWKVVSQRSGIPLKEIQQTEKTTTTGKDRRVGEFDWALLRQGASLNGPTDIALTFSDYLDVGNRRARRFEQLQPETIRFIEEVERVARAPVSLIVTRFHWRNIIDRRNW